MHEIYSEQHKILQHAFDTEPLAERVQAMIVQTEISAEHKAFIQSRDFFFLTTVDHRGYPTCSYKGGAQGFVKVLDNQTLLFPSYDGNGLFLSLGNISAYDKVGILFIDFETPHRLRVHGVARLIQEQALLTEFVGAQLLVEVKISEIFFNCPRYIHRYQRLQTSKYAPQNGCEITPAPQWKRIDAIQDVLPQSQQHIAEQLGGTLTPEEYTALLLQGQA